MQKKVRWTIALAALLISGAVYYFITLSLFKPIEDLYGFPVPNNAELIEVSSHGKTFEWSRASEENGIPYQYELALKKNGWKKGEREGASVHYTKGSQKINLISTTRQLGIVRVN